MSPTEAETPASDLSMELKLEEINDQLATLIAQGGRLEARLEALEALVGELAA